MAPLNIGVCATCAAEKVKLRPNPFNQTEQCEDCRTSEIIGVTDIKKTYGLKDGDLKDLQIIIEPQPAFLGGPDRRWYLVTEVEVKSEEVKAAKEAEQEKKQKTEAPSDEAPKRGRGRPKKGEVAAPKATKAKASTAAPKKAAPLKRKRATADDGEEAVENGGGDGTEEDEGITEAAEKTKPKPKAKAKAVAKPKAMAAEGAPVAKKGRGRPRKTATSSEA